MTAKTIIFLVSVCTLCSCSSDPACPEVHELGELNLVGSSYSSFPYGVDDNALVFGDSTGFEYYFSRDTLREYYANYYGSIYCSIDSSQIIKSHALCQALNARFKSDSLGIVISVSHVVLSMIIDYSELEVVDIGVFNLHELVNTPPDITTVIAHADATLDIRNWTSPLSEYGSVYKDSVTINNTVYHSVYCNENRGIDDFGLFYSLSNGAVGMINRSTGLKLNFLRRE